MAKLTLQDITGLGSAGTGINSNSALTEAAMENTLSRDGTTPNMMDAELDMNSNDVNNVNDLSAVTISLNGVPISTVPYEGLTLDDLTDVTVTAPQVDDVVSFNGSIWVNGPAAGGGGFPAYTLQSGLSYAPAVGEFAVMSNTGTVTVTLPTPHSVNDSIAVKKIGAGGTVTVDGSLSETIDGALTLVLNFQWDSVTLVSDGTNWLIV